MELSAFVKRLCEHRHVKVCVSSRPEQAYRDAFHNACQLRLQDLTRDDLNRYIRERIASMITYEDLRREDPAGVDRLVSSVCREADGVFLWARLVTNDIMDGLVAGDSLEMLFARLERADKTLEGLFQQFLERIDPVHRPKSAKYLQIMVHKHDTRASLLEFLLLDQPEFSSVIPTSAELNEVNDSVATTCDIKVKALKRHLVARCAGLLTVDEESCNACYESRANDLGAGE